MNIFSKNSEKTFKLLDKYKINVNNISNITNNIYFMKLYEDIKNNYEEIDINYIKITYLNESKYDYLEDSKFMSENIKKDIIDNLKFGYKYNYLNNEIIYYKNKKNNIISRTIIHMFQIINILKKIFNKKEYEQKVIYFETNKKKKFPNKNIILGSNEVNSGLTYITNHTNKNGNIILYRKEELLKVLIHELLHSNLIDFKIINLNRIKELDEKYCVKDEILLNEAFTESIATLIHIFYIHSIHKMELKYINIMFKNEMKYSNYIYNKIMFYYNIKDITEIIKKDNKCINNFLQKTNVFSYYILKNILLSKHLLLSEILKKDTINYKIISEKCITEIIHLVISNININKKIIIKDNNKSLRMCLYELNI